MSASDWGPDSPATIEPGTPALPSSVAADGRTPGPADTEERDGRKALRAELMGLILDAGTAGLAADVILASGYRRLVSDDEATVERVGWAIMHALARVAGEDHETTKAAWSEVGRAAVRALREAGQ